MLAVSIAMQETDRNGIYPGGIDASQERVNGSLVERRDDAAEDIDALPHGEAAVAWNEHVRLLEKDVVLIVATLVADLEDIAKSLGQDRPDNTAGALDQCICRKSRAMYDGLQRQREQLLPRSALCRWPRAHLAPDQP